MNSRFRVALGNSLLYLPTIILTSLFLSACSTNMVNYPFHWPNITQPSDGCVAFTGTYTSKCDCREAYWGQLKKTPLSTLFQDESLSDNATTGFSIRCPSSGILEISGHSPEGNTFTRTYAENKDYVYGEGKLTINLSAHPMGGVAVTPVPIWAVGAVSGKLELSLATDGSLIGQVIEKGGALLWLVIPVASEDNMWCRCERMDEMPNSMFQRVVPLPSLP